MLKNPKIIFLDEPTSALDSVSEQTVSDALENLFKEKTVIVIAHRLQTVREADDIIVLDKGEVIERGTHKQLEKKAGIYKKMLDLQTSF
jgi:ABC-type multidrug transport system fused ATPase/permease subunit